MAIKQVNFDIINPSHAALVLKAATPDFAGNNMPASMDPRITSSTNPKFYDGEWFSRTSAGKFTRAVSSSDDGTLGNAPMKPAYPSWSPVGEYSMQVREQLVIVEIGVFEAWTQLYHYSGSAATPLSGFAVGDRLVVMEGQPDGDHSDKHAVLRAKTTPTVAGALGMVVGHVIGKDNTKGLQIYCQAGGFGVWF